jgi:hypothetical protein
MYPPPGLDKYLVCRLHISAGTPWVEWRVDVHTARNLVAGPQGIRHTLHGSSVGLIQLTRRMRSLMAAKIYFPAWLV